MRLCLFSSYVGSPRIPDYVKYYLTQLLAHHDRTVLLVNDDHPLPAAELQWLAGRGIGFMPVRNEGYDFGMWQKALAREESVGITRLTLANDSCILFAPLTDFFRWFDESQVDVGGMLESQAYGRHLQSFFLVFRGERAQEAADYIRAHPVQSLSYQQIVETFELGMSRKFFQDPGCRIGAMFPVVPLAPLDDPSYFFMDDLLRAGLPLIKKKLLRRQQPGASIRRLVMAGADPAPEARVRLIRELHPMDDAQADLLFGDALRDGRQNTFRFNRRVLRFRLERLARQLFCLPLMP